MILELQLTRQGMLQPTALLLTGKLAVMHQTLSS